MKRLILLALLLAPVLAFGQQVEYVAPGGGGGGGAPSFPLLAGNGCVAPPYSFTDATDMGACRGLAAAWGFDSLILQGNDYESDFTGNFLQLTEDGSIWFAGTNDATGNGSTLYMQHPITGALWSNITLNSSNFTTGTGATANLETNAANTGVGYTRITVDSDPGLNSQTDFLADRTTFSDPIDLEDPGTKPTCDASRRGFFFFDEGGAGVADTVEVCAKDSGDAYAWRALATIP
jgi:hypothetical protein